MAASLRTTASGFTAWPGARQSTNKLELRWRAQVGAWRYCTCHRRPAARRAGVDPVPSTYSPDSAHAARRRYSWWSPPTQIGRAASRERVWVLDDAVDLI